ncbi:MAG TPA: class I SAM-dependent methyltransferase [Alphaproteobacteria bacterium]|jgi:trans-aconitate methyltransferase|nr:class I SAM-dependent methyltransferase [Alphaproteobacteria bacterium]
MKSLNLYQNNFKKFGVDHKSLLWKTRGAAHQRFRQFWKEINFDNKKVLDIGCGFGEFGKFLLKRYKNVDYTGIDINPEFIAAASKLVLGGRFEVADFNKLDSKYQVVIASGVLNSNTEGDNLEHRKNAIQKMFDLTSHVLAFNMLGGHPAPKNKKDSNVWYVDSLEILEFCMTLTSRVILRQNYHSKDFTIFLYKGRKEV